MAEAIPIDAALLVGDDLATAEARALALLDAGFAARVFAGTDDLIARASPGDASRAIVVVDPADAIGIEALGGFAAVLAVVGSEAEGIAAIDRGATDYRVRPIGPAGIVHAVRRVAEVAVLGSKAAGLAQALRAREGWERIVAVGGATRQVVRAARDAAASDAPLLLTGEAGTGKELIARAVHRQSARAGGPFVAADLAALAPDRIASDLFPEHGEGNAVAAARGGTLFVESVDRLPVDLHERFRRLLGTGGPRWIASSRTDPGAWPADLPGVLRIEVPPLRARAEDLRPLVAFFLDRHGAGTRRFDESALQLLSTHDWPGNVRELETLVARASLLSEAIELTASDLPPLGDARVRSLSTDVPDTAEALKRAKAGLRARSVEEIERAFLLRALNRGGWNVTRAAKATGLLRPNFQALMRKHGLRKRGA